MVSLRIVLVFLVVFIVAISLTILGAIGPPVTFGEEFGWRQCAVKVPAVGEPFVTDDYCNRRGKPMAEYGLEVPPRDQHIYHLTIPIKRKHRMLSPWNQYLVADVHFDLHNLYTRDIKSSSDPIIFAYEVAIGYRDNSSSHWTLLTKSNSTRLLDCRVNQWDVFVCDHVSLFELWSCHYHHYIVNLKILWLPFHRDYQHNSAVEDFSLFLIRQHSEFTMRWFILKSIFFPISLLILYYSLRYKPSLYQRSLIFMNICLVTFNVPVEWLSLWFDTNWIALFNDVRQGLLIFSLMNFWSILIAQCDDADSSISNVWKLLTISSITAIAFTVYEFCERGIQVFVPFFSLWGSTYGRIFAYSCLGVAISSSVLYCICLVIKLILVHRRIKAKLTESTSEDKTLTLTDLYQYLLLTLFVALLSILGYLLPAEIFLLHSIHGRTNLSLYGAILFGNYGLWNSYVAAVTIMSSFAIIGNKMLNKRAES